MRAQMKEQAEELRVTHYKSSIFARVIWTREEKQAIESWVAP